MAQKHTTAKITRRLSRRDLLKGTTAAGALLIPVGLGACADQAQETPATPVPDAASSPEATAVSAPTEATTAVADQETLQAVPFNPVSPDYFIPDRFKDKTILITGGAAGIGGATAIRAAREGANLVLVDLKEPEMTETARQIEADGGNVVTIVGDVRDTAICDQMIEEAVNTFGGLDYALNAAGVLDGTDPAAPYDPAANQNLIPNVAHLATDEYWDGVLTTNITGMFKSCRAELRQLIEQGRGGAIVNIGSIAGLIGLAGNPAYVASKHAVTGFTRNLAWDYASYGIRINSVNMAGTDTSMVERAGQFVMWARQNRPTNAMGQGKTKSIIASADPNLPNATVWEQAAIILFLFSDDASNLTGVVMATDGGWTAY